MKGIIRSWRPLLVGAFLVGAAATNAGAQVPFQGSTTACFFQAPAVTCTPVWSTAITNPWIASVIHNPSQVVQAPWGKLWYMNTAFSFLAPLGQTTFPLGEFSFGTGVPVLNVFFKLAVAMTQPSGNNLPYTATVTGALIGKVQQNGVPAVTLDFDPAGPGLDWTNGPFTFVGGTYAVSALGNQAFSDAENQPLYGVATVTPEPGVLTLLGTGLAGLAGALRRRRKTRA